MQPKRILTCLLAVILICLAAGLTVSAAEASPLKLAVSVSSETAVSTEPVTVQAGDTLEVRNDLAVASGVPKRVIQAFEMGYRDINKAQVITVLQLAEALDCDVYDIINPRV